MAAQWDMRLRLKAECIDEASHLLAAGCINTFIDFIICALPYDAVMQLDLPLRQRIALYCLFTGGLLASGAGAVRTWLTYEWTSSPTHDLTWYACPVSLSSAIELYIGIVSAFNRS